VQSPRQLDSLFSPRSVAVVGASRDPRKLGYIVLDSLRRGGFPGHVYAVNPSANEVLGVTAYESLAHIPGDVDLAVVVVPAACVPSVIDDCARKGVSGAVIISAGFREVGPEGRALEQEVVRRARAAGVRIVGPNSVGIINTFARLNTTFAEAQPLSYEVAFVSQSGAVATAILDWARSTGVGFSKFVSLGNMADLTEVELFEYLAGDGETNVIVAYLEGFSDGRGLVEAARHITPHKPIIVMKVGGSASGARAAMSHTGALAAPDAIVDGALRQCGIVRAGTMDELFDLTLAFSYVEPPAGPGVAIVTNAGGPGVMSADAVERSGLELARLSEVTMSHLREVLPSAAAIQNPVDILGDARSGRYQRALEAVIMDDAVDAVVVLLTPQAVTDAEGTARSIAHFARSQRKPVMAVYMGGEAVARGRAALGAARVPAYPYPERAIRALAGMWRYRDMTNPQQFVT
jgi:acetyltransferase